MLAAARTTKGRSRQATVVVVAKANKAELKHHQLCRRFSPPVTQSSPQQVFRLDAAVQAAVREHNAKWRGYWERFLAAAAPPRWERGVPISAEWRGLYETYLPVAEYVSSLRRLARTLPRPREPVQPVPNWLGSGPSERGTGT